jgi:S1-C subfamily serine protease
MAEGLFIPERCPIPALSMDQLVCSLVRIVPRTTLYLDWADDADDARRRARNDLAADGSECWYRYFTRDEAERIRDPGFHLGMVRHEFARHLRDGGSLPAQIPLEGGGTGFAITPKGHILTNYHLVTADVADHGREVGKVNDEVRCRTLRVQTARRDANGTWQWIDADAVWLVSNPPAQRAIDNHGNNTGSLREDTALLRVVPIPMTHLSLTFNAPSVGDPAWMAGFPLRTARGTAVRARVGYEDANGTLRVSRGHVTHVEGDDYFTTDCDGSMGNSGSPVIGNDGKVLGLFSRAIGDGPRNLLEYGHVARVQISARLAVEGLKLYDIEGLQGWSSSLR